jgi:hypothetical protein
MLSATLLLVATSTPSISQSTLAFRAHRLRDAWYQREHAVLAVHPVVRSVCVAGLVMRDMPVQIGIDDWLRSVVFGGLAGGIGADVHDDARLLGSFACGHSVKVIVYQCGC